MCYFGGLTNKYIVSLQNCQNAYYRDTMHSCLSLSNNPPPPPPKTQNQVCSVELMEGDAIIMGSDGLFDNIFDHEIVSTMASHTNVAEAAKALADLARNHSVDTKFDSPYSLEARARGFDVPSWKKFLGVKLTGMRRWT